MSPTCSKCKSKMYLNKVLEKHSLLAPCSSNSGFISATKAIVSNTYYIKVKRKHLVHKKAVSDKFPKYMCLTCGFYGSDVVENIKVNSVVGIKVRKRIKS